VNEVAIMSRKTKIVIGVTFVSVAVIISGLLIDLAAALEFSYRRKQAFQTFVIREHWIFGVFLISIEIFCIFYAVRAWSSLNSLKSFVFLTFAAAMSLPVFAIGTQYSTNVPFSFEMGGDDYVVPWNFYPDGQSHNGGSYLRVNATYPGFQPVLLDQHGKTKNGFRVRVSRQSNPDMLCFGLVGCRREVGVPRSKLPVSQQFLKLVRSNVNIKVDSFDFQDVWLVEPDKRTQYFYKKGTYSQYDTFGMCEKSTSFVNCVYHFSAGKYFYNVYVESHDPQSVGNWSAEREIPVLSAGVVKFIDSFIK
jgi:hypothetical protein